MIGWVLLFVVALLLSHGSPGMLLAIFAGLGVVAWLISLALHPFKVCRACGGSGRHQGAMFPWSHRQCAVCGGQTRHRRFGVARIYGDKKTRAERIAADARDNRRHRPRL